MAVHYLTREAMLILLAVLDEVGTLPGDRVEHGAIVPRETIDDIHRRGLTVFTQPGVLADRGDDYLRDVDKRDLPDLYRCRSLMDADVPVALSSDAPHGPLDPWAAMATAMSRCAPNGRVADSGERITAAQALADNLTPADNPGRNPRRIKVGRDRRPGPRTRATLRRTRRAVRRRRPTHHDWRVDRRAVGLITTFVAVVSRSIVDAGEPQDVGRPSVWAVPQPICVRDDGHRTLRRRCLRDGSPSRRSARIRPNTTKFCFSR